MGQLDDGPGVPHRGDPAAGLHVVSNGLLVMACCWLDGSANRGDATLGMNLVSFGVWLNRWQGT